jgi:hypothetical protein
MFGQLSVQVGFWTFIQQQSYQLGMGDSVLELWGIQYGEGTWNEKLKIIFHAISKDKFELIN